MTTELFQKRFSRFDTNLNWVKTFLFDPLHVGNFDSRNIFHAHDFLCRILWVCFGCPDVLELWYIKIVPVESIHKKFCCVRIIKTRTKNHVAHFNKFLQEHEPKTITIFHFIQIIDFFIQKPLALLKDTNPITLRIPIEKTTF